MTTKLISNDADWAKYLNEVEKSSAYLNNRDFPEKYPAVVVIDKSEDSQSRDILYTEFVYLSDFERGN